MSQPSTQAEPAEPDYRRLFEATPAPHLVLTPDLTIVAVNEAYLRATLTTRGRILGRKLFDVFPDHPGDRDASGVANLRRSLRRVLRRKAPDAMAVQRYDMPLDGGGFEPRYRAPLNTPVLDEDGQVTHIIHRAEDVSDLVQARECAVTAQRETEAALGQALDDAGIQAARLRESEAKFRAISDAMPQMVWSTLADGTPDYFNPRFYDFAGVPHGSIQGDRWADLFHPADLARTWMRWRHSLRTGEPYEIEYRMRHHTGEYRWVLGRALPLRDEQGHVTRWMGTCTDIHEQVIARELLHDEARRKDEFLAMLAHELRNPLAPIRTAAAVLPATTDGAQMRQLAAVITRQVGHMTRLVDDLLDVSRVTRGLVRLELQADDLRTIAAIAIEQVRPLIDRCRHTLVTHLPDTPVPLRADRTRLVQVVANLLNNAAKYTPEGGRIELRVETSDDEAVLGVRDEGIGIDAQLLPHVFDLFSQGKRDPDRSLGGLGIGLALARSITLLHGGHIVGTSNGRGLGSEFVVRLPLARAGGVSARARGEAGSAAPPQGCHVVVVDDNVDAARTIAMALGMQGHRVSACHDAAAALAVTRDDPAPVYIIDIGLPDMPGHDLARLLRNTPETADAMLIALTGYGRPEDHARSREAGFNRHFVKPVDIAELRDVIASVAGCAPAGVGVD